MYMRVNGYSTNASCVLNSIFMSLLDKCLKITQKLLNQEPLLVTFLLIYFVFIKKIKGIAKIQYTLVHIYAVYTFAIMNLHYRYEISVSQMPKDILPPFDLRHLVASLGS